MRYFTIEWWRGDLGEAESDAAVEAYRRHLDSIRDRLPPVFSKAGEEPVLHDRRLLRLEFEPRSRTARLTFEDFVLVYHGVEEFISTADPKKGLGGPHGYGDLGYDEKDILENGLYEHRLLFSTGIMLQLQFVDFSVEAPPDPAALPVIVAGERGRGAR